MGTLLVGALIVPPGASSAGVGCGVSEGRHEAAGHGDARRHRSDCGFEEIGSLEVSKEAGLGQIAVHDDVAAVLQRDEGIVSLLDVGDPRRPRLLGRFDDGCRQCLDGDLAFSKDGKWLFYARQTRQFSKDGVLVLDVSDPKSPTLASYQPAGGTLRIAYFEDDGREYVFTLDAVYGLVSYRFDLTRAGGLLLPIGAEPFPALKVGGPASGGLFIDERDPALGVPLLYAATGGDGLGVYDITVPESPQRLAAWDEAGLAAIEVDSTRRRRTIYAATEYWFDDQTKPEIVVLGYDKNGIEEKGRLSLGLPADPQHTWRVQGIELAGRHLYVAHSHAGLVALDGAGGVHGATGSFGTVNDGAGAALAPYAMDVSVSKGIAFVTDAATGTFTALRPIF